MKITRASVVIALSTALLLSSGTFATQSSAFYTETDSIPAIINPVTTNAKGVVELQTDALLDFIIPDTINGVTVDAIGAYAFEGCDLIRTVSIPSSVTEIGDYAFAGCPYLQTIILTDRSDLQNLNLGTNWAGDAQVICEYTLKVPAISPGEQTAFRQVLADAENIHEISEKNLSFAKNHLTVMQEIYMTLLDEDPNSEDTISFDTGIQRLSRLIQEYEISIQFTEPPSDLVPDDSQVISENGQNSIGESTISDGFIPEHLPQEPSPPVEETLDPSTPSTDNRETTDTSASNEPSVPPTDATLPEEPAADPQQ